MTEIFEFFVYRIRRFFEIVMVPSVTIQYPFVKKQIPVLSRSSLRLDQAECTGCLSCQTTCPVDAVSVTTKEFTDEIVVPNASNGTLFERQLVQLEIDYRRCLFCNICVEACETKALTYGREPAPVEVKLDALVKKLVLAKAFPKNIWQEGPL